jgi:hypothetical protein
METKLLIKERYKLLKKAKRKYLRLDKKKKGELLSFLEETTGLTRKRIIQIFTTSHIKPKKEKEIKR